MARVGAAAATLAAKAMRESIADGSSCLGATASTDRSVSYLGYLTSTHEQKAAVMAHGPCRFQEILPKITL